MLSSLARITSLMRRQSVVEASNKHSQQAHSTRQRSARGQSCPGNQPHLPLPRAQTRIDRSTLNDLCNKSPLVLRSVITQCVVFVAAFCVLTGAQAQQRTFPDFTTLVENNSAAVVNISITQKRTASPRLRLPKGIEIPDLPEDSPFNEFFRRFFGEEGDNEEFDSQSLGSGFIISADGYVISNNHVVQGADVVVVRLIDRREFTAEVVGTDPRSDVALLKIEATNLPVVKLGTKHKVKVGEWVLAIGSPFGFDHSVTAGIVSAIGRNLPRENYVPFIQTDVAINPGNSGGPLFNLNGEVIGVNSQIFSRTGGFMGLSFAIPIGMAMDVVDQLRDKGRVSRGWLGVLIQDVTRELAESFGMDKPEGALIAKVLPDSPASKAGFEVGDIVLEFNGQAVDRSSKLPPIVGATPIGMDAPVVISRNGKVVRLMVRTSELPEAEDMQAAVSGKPGIVKAGSLGITVADLTPEQRKENDAPAHGVIVTQVDDGPAKTAGVRAGDLVLMLDNIKVPSAKAFKAMVDDLPPSKPAPLLVQRQGNPIFLAIKPRN
ncbi:MAG: serine protease Do [Gammaproteobacteria bacterium]|jgi:serine protease Do